MNIGKIFERNWEKSIPKDVFCRRLPDPPQSFEKTAIYSHKNPYDYEVFFDGSLFCLELKSVGTSSCSFEAERGTRKTANIHWHQIDGLSKAAQYEGIFAGFLVNWRLKDGVEIVLYQSISDFKEMISEINKKSFNMVDMAKHGGIRVESEKKKINYKYDVKKLISDIKEKQE